MDHLDGGRTQGDRLVVQPCREDDGVEFPVECLTGEVLQLVTGDQRQLLTDRDLHEGYGNPDLVGSVFKLHVGVASGIHTLKNLARQRN